jgi:virulence factor
MEKVKLGIIGAGFFAEKHLEVLNAFDDVEIVGISGRGNPRIHALADRFGIQNRFDSYDRMLAESQPDAVMILVDALNIFPVSLRILELGVPTFLEKPPGLLVSQARQLRDTAAASGSLNMVGLNRRFYSVARKAQDIIEAAGPLVSVAVEAPERLGEIKGVHPHEIVARLLFANGIHSIDLLRFFGGDVKTIHAIARQLNEDQKNSFGALIEFQNGALGQYISHWTTPGTWNVTLYGIGQRIELNPLERGVRIDSSGQSNIEPDDIDLKFKPGLYAQARYFVDCVKENRQPAYPAANLDEALKTMELVAAIAGDIE